VLGERGEYKGKDAEKKGIMSPDILASLNKAGKVTAKQKELGTAQENGGGKKLMKLKINSDSRKYARRR